MLTKKDNNSELKETTEFAPATMALLRRQALVIRHRLKSAISKGGIKGIVARLFYVGAYLTLPVASAIKLGWSKLTIGAFITLLWTNGRKAWRENAPQNMLFLERHHLERKYALGNLIEEMHRMDEMTPAEVQSFRERTLGVVALYVRDHRADWKGRSIFANLLIEDGEDLVVIARSETHRLPAARYPRAQLAASKVFDTGEAEVVGDLLVEYPGEASKAKKYSSILVLPIYLGEKIAGVVSLDSEEKYHFDGEVEQLWDWLLRTFPSWRGRSERSMLNKRQRWEERHDSRADPRSTSRPQAIPRAGC